MRKSGNGSSTKKKIRPASNPEAREAQLINLAIDLVEKRLIEGTASSQETTHYLKLAATREKRKTEQEILEGQRDLIIAKTEALQSSKKIEELYENAIKAFGTYRGEKPDD